MMRSPWEILCAITDGEINTPEEAEAILREQCTPYAVALKTNEHQAYVYIRDTLTKLTNAYFLPAQRERFDELFNSPLKEKDAREERTP